MSLESHGNTKRNDADTEEDDASSSILNGFKQRKRHLPHSRCHVVWTDLSEVSLYYSIVKAMEQGSNPQLQGISRFDSVGENVEARRNEGWSLGNTIAILFNRALQLIHLFNNFFVLYF